MERRSLALRRVAQRLRGQQATSSTGLDDYKAEETGHVVDTCSYSLINKAPNGPDRPKSLSALEDVDHLNSFSLSLWCAIWKFGTNTGFLGQGRLTTAFGNRTRILALNNLQEVDEVHGLVTDTMHTNNQIFSHSVGLHPRISDLTDVGS